MCTPIEEVKENGKIPVGTKKSLELRFIHT